MKTNSLLLFLRLSRPLFLLGGVLNYFLGLGIAHYLGVPLDISVLLLGQAWVTSLQLATHYLNEYFDFPNDLFNHHRTPFTGGSGVLGSGEDQLNPRVALAAAAVTLGLAAVCTFALGRLGALNPLVVTIMGIAVLGTVFYSTPPLRLAASGYGELTTAILLATLVPAFGYALQTGDLHRFWCSAPCPWSP